VGLVSGFVAEKIDKREPRRVIPVLKPFIAQQALFTSRLRQHHLQGGKERLQAMGFDVQVGNRDEAISRGANNVRVIHG
jgi:hypothetical protein